MAETTKARVGLLGLMLELYDRWPELKPLMAELRRGAGGYTGAVRRRRFPRRLQYPRGGG